MAWKRSTGTAMTVMRVRPVVPEKNMETCKVCLSAMRWPCRDPETRRLLYVTHTTWAAARKGNR